MHIVHKKPDSFDLSSTAKNLVTPADTWADLVVLCFCVTGSVEFGLA